METFVRIRIQERNKKLVNEIVVPPLVTVQEVLDIALEIFNLKPDDKDKKASDYYYGVWYDNSWLDKRRNLLFYEIDQDNGTYPFELKERRHTKQTVSVKVGEKQKVDILINEDETVWTVSQKLCRKLQQGGFEGSLLNWYLTAGGSSEYDIADENYFMYEYKADFNSLHFLEIPTKTEKFSIIYQGQKFIANLDPNFSASQGLKMFINNNLLNEVSEVLDIDSYQFAIQDKVDFNSSLSNISEEAPWVETPDVWVNPADLLEDHLNSDLELKKRCEQIKIRISIPGSKDIVHCLTLDQSCSLKTLYTILHNNFTKSRPKDENYVLYFEDGNSPLDPKRAISSYIGIHTQTLHWRKRLQPIHIFSEADGKATFYCDFDAPVSVLTPMIASAYGISNLKGDGFKLKRISPDLNINKAESLSNQPIPVVPGETLIFKLFDQGTLRSTLLKSKYVDIWADDIETNSRWSEDNRLRAGNINSIITYLTHPEHLDKEWEDSFLSSFSDFMTSDELLTKLIERFRVPSHVENGEKIQARVCLTLKAWLLAYPNDFSHALIERVHSFKDDDLPRTSPIFRKFALDFDKAILNRMCALRTTDVISKSTVGPAIITKQEKNIPGLLAFNSLEIARQLTIQEFDLFKKIPVQELRNQKWSKRPAECPNMQKFTNNSNGISMWVVKTILDQTRCKNRALRWEKIIKIAEHLRSLNNFSTLTAFIGGWNNSAVQRLSHTRDMLSKGARESMQALEDLMSPMQSYRNYRDALMKAAPPCIPYLGVHLQDLIFIDEGNPDLIDDLYNVEKKILFWKSVTQIDYFQNISFRLLRFDEILLLTNFTEDIVTSSQKEFDNQMYQLSLQREPRGAKNIV